MEPPVQVYHLREDPRKLQRDLIPIDVVVRQVHQVIHTSTLNIFHDEDALPRLHHLRCTFASREYSSEMKWHLRMYIDVRTFSKSATARSAFTFSCTKSISFGRFSRISSPSHVNSKVGNQCLIHPIQTILRQPLLLNPAIPRPRTQEEPDTHQETPQPSPYQCRRTLEGADVGARQLI